MIQNLTKSNNTNQSFHIGSSDLNRHDNDASNLSTSTVKKSDKIKFHEFVRKKYDSKNEIENSVRNHDEMSSSEPTPPSGKMSYSERTPPSGKMLYSEPTPPSGKMSSSEPSPSDEMSQNKQATGVDSDSSRTIKKESKRKKRKGDQGLLEEEQHPIRNLMTRSQYSLKMKNRIKMHGRLRDDELKEKKRKRGDIKIKVSPFSKPRIRV